VPNFILFPQAVLWAACHRLPERKKAREGEEEQRTFRDCI